MTITAMQVLANSLLNTFQVLVLHGSPHKLVLQVPVLHPDLLLRHQNPVTQQEHALLLHPPISAIGG